MSNPRAMVAYEEQIAQLERRIAELESRLPRHSVPPAMLIELDELEDELKALKRCCVYEPV